MGNDEHTSGGLSYKAAGFAVMAALLAGLVLSLAFRPPGHGAAQTATQSTAEGPAIRWRVPVSINTSLAGIGDGILRVAEFIDRSSAGRFRLDVYEPGEVAPALGVFDAVREGKTDAGYTWLGYSQGIIPASPLFAAVPFGMNPTEFASWWYEGTGQQLAENIFKRFDTHVMLCGLVGPETAGWFRRPIKDLEDLAGLKVRFAGIGGRIIERLGASVTMLPGGEIFQALEKGAIDATEYSLPSADQALGFDRIASYNYFPGWHQTFTSNHLLVNINAWNALSANNQALLETACTAGVARSLAHSESLQGPVIAGFASRGVTATRLPIELLQQLKATAAEVMQEEAAKDEDFRKIWASQKAFREVFAHWNRLAYLPRDF